MCLGRTIVSEWMFGDDVRHHDPTSLAESATQRATSTFQKHAAPSTSPTFVFRTADFLLQSPSRVTIPTVTRASERNLRIEARRVALRPAGLAEPSLAKSSSFSICRVPTRPGRCKLKHQTDRRRPGGGSIRVGLTRNAGDLHTSEGSKTGFRPRVFHSALELRRRLGRIGAFQQL